MIFVARRSYFVDLSEMKKEESCCGRLAFLAGRLVHDVFAYCMAQWL